MGFKKRGCFLLVLAVIFLVFSTIQVLGVDGCYTFVGNDESIHCVTGIDSAAAQADCDNFQECEFSEEFFPNVVCSDKSECETITCDVDCADHSREWCAQLGLNDQFRPGEEVIDFNNQCNAGCCKVERSDYNSCDFGATKYQCDRRAFRAGVSPGSYLYSLQQSNGDQMTPDYCQATVCGVDLTQTPVSGRVVDSSAQAIVDVTIVLDGTQIGTGNGITYNTDGTFLFDNGLNPGSYRIRVSANGFTPVIVPFNIALQQENLVIEDIVLLPLTDQATVSGKVTDKETSTGIQSALISWGSDQQQRTTTNNDGDFSVTLPQGTYTFRVSKEGFSTTEREIDLTQGEVIAQDFELERPQFQGVRGSTEIDTQGYGDFVLRSAVKIFVDGIFKGFSQANSRYEVFLEPGEHIVTAKFTHDKEYEAGPHTITISRGQVEALNLQLTAPDKECDEPGEEKNVDAFIGSVAQGKKEITLRWARPCPEVTGYEIRKFEGSTQIGEPITVPALFNTYIDNKNLDWGGVYVYRIVTIYNDRRSPDPAPEVTVPIGSDVCEGLYNEETSSWAQFCSPDLPRLILKCNEQNVLEEFRDCSTLDVPGEKEFYCARVSDTKADCKDIGICLRQDSDPFGLYNKPDMCYGSENPVNGNSPNFCYYDYSKKTITNVCESCIKPGDTTEPIDCFDYRSKSACEINNCAATACAWIDGASMASTELVDYSILYPGLNVPSVFVTPDTGMGYCVEEDFEGDRCSLCGENAEIFENYFCTADVCTNLGRCFSNPPSRGEALSSCDSCGELPTLENNCYTYTTQLECTKGNPLQENNGEIVLSQDVCSWGRCSWNEGSCVKDGDGDRIDDCKEFVDRERQLCVADNTAPTTKIVPDSFHLISEANTNLTFNGVDNQNEMGTLHFCLNDALAPEKCGFGNNFVAYEGETNDESLSINMLDARDLKDKLIPGESFLLRYYSKDKYFNQEEAHEIFIFVDNVKPNFEINEEISTVVDKTSLTVFLEGLDEPAVCDFQLTQTLPPGDVRTDVVNRDELSKQITYSDLLGVGYAINVTCTDDFGNVMKKSKLYTFDLEERINIIYPPFQGSIGETSIIFRIETDVGATCQLFSADNEVLGEFVTDETGKEHRTPVMRGFFEKEYAAEHKAVCRELLDETEIFEDYFHFTVDFTPPDTLIVLSEGSREVRPVTYGWDEIFINEANVDFECRVDGGFACDRTMFCLGDGCQYIADPKFEEYTATVNIKETTQICYYSYDQGGNVAFQPICGTIHVDGFGIDLEKPIKHTYNDEVWGVSAEPIFDWQFSTRVPATECKFDFTQDFDFNNIPGHKTRTPNAQGKYLFENFPESVFTDFPGSGGVKKVYVKCVDINGVISPEQKFNLEYDPSAPRILDAFADPDPVLEDVSTNLFLSTDDKTLCRYNDDSDGIKSEYDTMKFSFPGENEKILGEIHNDIFNINFVGRKKTYLLNTQCKNGAGTLSEVEPLSFEVDYSDLGNIVFIYPDGHSFTNRDINLQVETTKEAVCEYRVNGTFKAFETTDSITHSKSLFRLDEGEYVIPVKCAMGDHVAEAKIGFVIDVTPPFINKVEDGNYTCGNSNFTVFVYSDEANVTLYSYEVFDQGVISIPGTTTASRSSSTSRIRSARSSTRINTSSTTSLISGSKVFNATVEGNSPLKVSTENLLENHTYSVEVKARDAAGNWGQPKRSDGVVVVGSNFSVCVTDRAAPDVTFNINSETTCTSVTVELRCTDAVGCSDLRYGLAKTSELCKPERDYNGRKLEFSESGYVCFYVEDAVGNNYTQIRKVTFEDEDGDGIRDGCDNCSDTQSGKVSGIDGCAIGQVPSTPPGLVSLDTDGDSLPDIWEQTYNSLDCALDYLNKDSNGDSTSDNREDYDSDGRTNFEEYLDTTHPCKKDEKPVKDPEVRPPSIIPSVIINESNIVPWILFIIGVVMMLSGIGYLIYFYQNEPQKQSVASMESFDIDTQSTQIKKSTKTVLETPQQKEMSFGKRRRMQRMKSRKRKSLFETFGKESQEIPHVEKMLSTKDKSPQKLQEVAKKYVEHKDEIKQGLKQKEKSVFDQLEGVVKKTKGKKTKKVSKKKAEDVFSKLKKITKDRKK